MASDLTGAFDVVAEFSVGAINRVLAAMHSNERLPHSLSVRVDPKLRFPLPVVDYSGLALANPADVARVGPGVPLGGGSSTVLSRLLTEVLDPVVNTVGNAFPPPPPPNPLHGVAQLQLGAPTVSFLSSAPSQATIHMPLMAQYVPDPNTFVIPQFLPGEIQMTFAATQQASNAGTVIHIDFPAQGNNIRFAPAQPLDPTASVSINAALESSLHGTFQPSNTPLPDQLTSLRLWTMPQFGAAAVLMNLKGGQPPPGELFSWNSFFLGAQDQFALAVSSDYLKQVLEAEFNQDLASSQTFTFSHHGTIIHANGTGTLGQAAITFNDGYVLLTLTGHVHVSTNILGDHDSDITLRQKFTLSLINGAIHLQLLGDLDVDPSSTIFEILDWLFGTVTNNARAAFQASWNSSQTSIQSEIGGKLNTGLLQGFLERLMNPVSEGISAVRTLSRISSVVGIGTLGGIFFPPPPVTLALTSVEIRHGGVVLHGTLTVLPFPAAHPEFELVPNTAGLQHPEYSALNSWIPGGTIQNYVWTYGGQSRAPDNTKFLSTDAPSLGLYGAIEVPSGTCVTLHGAHISASGPVITQGVTAGVCNGVTSTVMSNDSTSTAQVQPDVSILQVSSAGKLELVGHASPWAAPGAPRSASANVLAHFPDAKSLAHLDALENGLKESGRTDAQTSILCVLAPGQLEQIKNPAGMLFADDSAGWEQRLGVKSRPATVLLAPSGKILWRREGALDPRELAQLLKRNLSAQSRFSPQVMRLPLKTGDRGPNFAFEYSPGRQLTLRKLSGRQSALVFIKKTKPSEDTLAAVQKLFASSGTGAPVLLAIDNSDSQGSKNAAAAHPFPGIMVPDSRREISNAYGVKVWPTVVFLDEQGSIQEVRQGILNVKDGNPPAPAPAGVKP